MLQLELLYRLLDELRTEAIDAAERPSTDYQSEFGFGRVSGMLQALREIRERIDAVLKEEQAHARAAEGDDTDEEEKDR